MTCLDLSLITIDCIKLGWRISSDSSELTLSCSFSQNCPSPTLISDPFCAKIPSEGFSSSSVVRRDSTVVDPSVTSFVEIDLLVIKL
ncbi:unnamed protein product [Moneuplotes crassus]|uniref:Uncharacterized protein n=1 Tax=Euplotes crassus TaxID=5936 RepID=A0AAD1UDG0_EUPCR|nr:unnamed protein product [Moneuplotes crassus]